MPRQVSQAFNLFVVGERCSGSSLHASSTLLVHAYIDMCVCVCERVERERGGGNCAQLTISLLVVMQNAQIAAPAFALSN